MQILAVHQHVAQDQAAELKWLRAVRVVAQLQAAAQAAVLKSLHAILAELHLAIADVA